MKSKMNMYVASALFLLALATSCTPKMRVESVYAMEATGKENAAEAINTNNVNAKVLRSFYRAYGEMPDAKWSKSANGFMVSFRSNNMNNTIYYRNSGTVDAALHYYSADRLVPSVRSLVQSALPNYTLFTVVEVKKQETTAFYV